MKEKYSEIGKKILQALAQKMWNQLELANRSGVSRQVIGNIMKGKVSPTTRTLEKLAKALNKPLSYLMDIASSSIDTNNIVSGHKVSGSHIKVNGDINVNYSTRMNLLEEEVKVLRLQIELLKKDKKR
jgi:transcriptional regulator with XRE-family HTH domain